MATADSLVLELGVKSEDLLNGLARAVQAVDALADRFEGLGKSLDSIASRFSPMGESARKGMDTAEKSASGLGDTLDTVGDKGVASAKKISKAFDNTNTVFSKLGKTIAGVFSIAEMRRIASLGEELDKYVKRTGLDATKIDALGKATELAGGNASVMRAELDSWLKSGRSLEDFLYIGKRVDALPARERRRFLSNLKLSPDATAMFQEFGSGALDVAKSLEAISIKPEQLRSARQFTQTFTLFKEHLTAIGRLVGDVVFPIVTNLMERCNRFMRVLIDNSEDTKKIIGVIVALMGVKLLGYLGRIVGAFVSLLGLTTKLGTKWKLLGSIFLAPFRPLMLAFAGVWLIVKGIEEVLKRYPNEVEAFRKKLTEIPIIGKLFRNENEIPKEDKEPWEKKHEFLAKGNSYRNHLEKIPKDLKNAREGVVSEETKKDLKSLQGTIQKGFTREEIERSNAEAIASYKEGFKAFVDWLKNNLSLPTPENIGRVFAPLTMDRNDYITKDGIVASDGFKKSSYQTSAPVQNVSINNELNYMGNSNPDDIMRGMNRVMGSSSTKIQRMLGVGLTGTCVKA